GYNIRAGKIGKDNIAARQGYCEFTSDHRLGHSAASGDIDLIDEKSMFVKDVCILGKIEGGLGCADGAVGDGDAFSLGRRGCGNGGNQPRRGYYFYLSHKASRVNNDT